MLTLIKFGGSVITDKTQPEVADLPVIRRLAAEVHAAQQELPQLRIVLGHGSGSFGHTYAHRYGVHRGLQPTANWMGFAQTAAAAQRLNRMVVDTLLAAGVPALALQPSTTLRSRAGHLQAWDTTPIGLALAHGLTPVVYGDVAFDTTQGSAIISTEQLLTAIVAAPDLHPRRIILVGESGVYTADPHLDPHATRIPQIDHSNIAEVLRAAAGSRAVDVTGGMRSKVELMWRLVEQTPGLVVQLIAPEPGLLHAALLDRAAEHGTRIMT
ncbi:MAG TPA: isopentenyl phosphate kinase [Roseiflexaceae bacterium]|nr:isopentenyl phosphate kinase [Roseiflexaceae bacterium]HMP41707.1 isopentenyl phosphate kinase [Roseiflexaceae bacterium]